MFTLTHEIKTRLGICGLADAYKPTHAYQYPKLMESASVYFESRKNGFAKDPEHGKLVWFGIWAFVKQYLSSPLTAEQVEASAEFWAKVGVPFPKDEFMYCVEEYGGHLPLEIRTLPEGMVADTHTALYTIDSMDKKVVFMPAFIETVIQMSCWYPSTVATLSWYVKKDQIPFWEASSDEPMETLWYKLHDFGFRGASSMETATLGAMSHAICSYGSDTSVANLAVELLYGNAPSCTTCSIPAMEHMTSTAWGTSFDAETEAVRNFIEKFCTNGGMGSVIADTRNVFRFCEELLGERLYDLITGPVAESGGCVIVRPDSGDCTRIPIRVMEILADKFGHTVNSKGFKVLPPYLRVIQGDGMNLDTIRQLYHNMALDGWSIDNIAVGMGGGLLQKVNRDTLGFAQKGSEVTVDGVSYGISKDPITDPGKKSQEGQFSVVRKDGKLVNVPRGSVPESEDYLRTIYKCGVVVTPRVNEFEVIRMRAHTGLVREVAREKVAVAAATQTALDLGVFPS